MFVSFQIMFLRMQIKFANSSPPPSNVSTYNLFLHWGEFQYSLRIVCASPKRSSCIRKFVGRIAQELVGYRCPPSR